MKFAEDTVHGRTVSVGWGVGSDGKTWTPLTGNMTLSVAGNAAHVQTPGTTHTDLQYGTQTEKRVEVLVRFAVSDVTETAYVLLRIQSAGNQYRIGYRSTHLHLETMVANVNTDIATTSFTPTVGTLYWIRARIDGGDTAYLSGRVWQDGDDEPTGWMVTGADATFPQAGGYGLGASAVTLSGVRLDLLVVTDGRGNGNLEDLAVVKRQMVYVFDKTGAFLDCYRAAPLVAGVKDAVNAGPQALRLVLPLKFDAFDLSSNPGSRNSVARGNIVQVFVYGPGLPTAGMLRYQGVIEAWDAHIDSSGQETVTLTIVPYASVLEEHAITGSQTFGTPFQTGTYVDPRDMIHWFFTNTDPNTGNPYMAPLTWAGGNPASSGRTAQYTFSAMKMGDVMNKAVAMLPANWFFRVNPDLSFTLRQTDLSTPTHTFVIGQHVAAPDWRKDWTVVQNAAFFKGAANPAYAPETVTVTDASGGSFTATYQNSHHGTYQITLDPGFTVATTVTGAATGVGVQVITPASMTNILAGLVLVVEPGGASETVTVSAVTSSTFTATFSASHPVGSHIQIDPGFTVNTTASGAIAPGARTLTPASMTHIVHGIKLLVGVGGDFTLPVTSYQQNGSSVGAIGQRIALASDNRVIDQNTCDTLAQGMVDINGAVQVRGTVRVLDFRGDQQPNLGYDIETIQVGQSCTLVHYTQHPHNRSKAQPMPEPGIWGTENSVYTSPVDGTCMQISALTYNFDSVDLELSSRQPNLIAAILRIQQQFDDFTIY